MRQKQHTFFVITFHAAGAQTPAGPLKLQGTVNAYPGGTVAASRVKFYRAVLNVRRSLALKSSYTVHWHTYDGTDNPPVDSGMIYHHEDSPIMAHHYSREVVEREPVTDEPETLSACTDCLLVVEGCTDDIDADREGEIMVAMKEYTDAGRTLHGGERCDEFSVKACELCGSRLAGERHTITVI